MIELYKPKTVQVAFWVLSGANPATSVVFSLGGNVMGAAGAVNPGLPRAAKLGRLFICSLTAGDTNPGDWTLRIRKNESGSDTATATFGVTTTLTKTSKRWSADALFQAGDTYHIVADGPGKVAFAADLVMEWEMI